MIFSNVLSTFILRPDIKGLCDKNICSIQDIMRTNKPASKKFKRVCKYLSNMAILAKRATLGEVQQTLEHASVGNKYLGGSVSSFVIIRLLEAPTVVSNDAKIASANSVDKIWVPFTKVLLCVGNLDRSKKQRDWMVLNAILLPLFLVEDAILDGKTSAANLLKAFTKCITAKGAEEEEDNFADK